MSIRLYSTLSAAAWAAVALPHAAFAQGATPMNATTTGAGDLSFEQVFASPSLDGSSPRGVKLSPDGRFLTLLRNRQDDKDRYDLWAFDRESGEWSMMVDSLKLGSGAELSEAEKMQRERQRIGSLKGIVAYDWSADGKAVLVPLDGALYLARLDGTTAKLDTGKDPLNPALSETGRYLSFVREGRLFVGPVGSAPVAITPPEPSELVHWGEAEFVAQEELDRDTGYWWSPNDARIAVERFDETPVGVVTRAAIGADGTRTFDQRYPAAGTPNADVSLHVMDPDGGNRVEVDLGGSADMYLARVDWAKDGRTLYVQRLDRLQTRLDMLKVDPATGRSEVLFTEKAAPGHWINLSKTYRWLDDGSLIWWSERDGYGHLHRYAKGTWTQLTKGKWVVTGLAGVDQKAGRLVFNGRLDDPLSGQVYALDYRKPGKPVRLSDPEFSTEATMDAKGRSLIVSRSGPAQPPQTFLADAAGARLAWINENALDSSHPYAKHLASHRTPQFGSIKANDGSDLHWKMIAPALEPGKRYPVFFSHYGGPHAQVVTKSWGGALQQAVVDAGYIWFELDNRGSANRGVEFEKPIHHAMGGVEVADQKAGAEYLKSLAFVDPARIATYGWSYGGYITLKMLQADQGLYAAGIAGAPVTKWELYDTAYTERYMGLPTGEGARAYAASNALDDAAKIVDPLLLIHGMSDDNVVFDNSSMLIARLQSNAVPFEMMLYPGQAHGVRGPRVSPHLWRTIVDFLARNGVPGGGR